MTRLSCTQWIALSDAEILARQQPNLTPDYLPHFASERQRFGPEGCDMPRLVGELDAACQPLLDAAAATGAQVWLVSEYGHVQVRQPISPNRALRQGGFLTVRPG